MKRNTAAVVTTVSTAMLGAGWAAGLVGTALAANSGGVSIDALGNGNGVVGTASGPSSSPTASASPSASPSSGATASPAPDAAAAPDATSTAPAATSAAPAPPPPPPVPAGPSGTFDGASVRTQFGSYQAELVIADGKITSISMLDSGASDGTSREISGYALPILIDAVLQNQTANVSYVSGASYTSQGFLTSVNDALVQAGLA